MMTWWEIVVEKTTNIWLNYILLCLTRNRLGRYSIADLFFRSTQTSWRHLNVVWRRLTSFWRRFDVVLTSSVVFEVEPVAESRRSNTFFASPFYCSVFIIVFLCLKRFLSETMTAFRAFLQYTLKKVDYYVWSSHQVCKEQLEGGLLAFLKEDQLALLK